MKPDPDRNLQGGTRVPGAALMVPGVLLLLVLALAIGSLKAEAAPPDVGEKAPDFALQTPEGATVNFDALLKEGKVVLIVLRGYPGYQCPYSQRQGHDFVAEYLPLCHTRPITCGTSGLSERTHRAVLRCFNYLGIFTLTTCFGYMPRAFCSPVGETCVVESLC
jgi:hypothetical protein